MFIGMGAAFALLVAGLARPSPASVVPGATEVRGIFHVTRHPVLMSFALYGLLHLCVVAMNATELAFFAGFPLFVWIGARHQDQRKLASGGEAVQAASTRRRRSCRSRGPRASSRRCASSRSRSRSASRSRSWCAGSTRRCSGPDRPAYGRSELVSTTPRAPQESAMPPVTDAAVLDALRPIVDPDFGKSIVDLGFVKNLRIDGRERLVRDRAHDARLPGEGGVREGRARARRRRSPASTTVAVTMTANTRGRARRRAARPTRCCRACATRSRSRRARAASARARSRSTSRSRSRKSGAAVGLMDADVYGPSLPLLTGVHGRPRAEEKRILPHEAARAEAHVDGLLRRPRTRR